ncbi:uncharacterized protein FFNC_15681 [Fusarium fujikuroi]|nr:uncharacterized protein FFNC_15681 [Fusarium fujikuroi]
MRFVAPEKRVKVRRVTRVHLRPILLPIQTRSIAKICRLTIPHVHKDIMQDSDRPVMAFSYPGVSRWRTTSLIPKMLLLRGNPASYRAATAANNFTIPAPTR